jgi:hypothetical protein
MKIKRGPTKLQKKARRGDRGYPAATVAFYGPDATRASKVAVGIVPSYGGEPTALETWQSDSSDVRVDARIGEEILEFIRQHGALTVVMTDRIIGCPHEEGIDYPLDAVCPICPYWENRDRWTGERLTEE